MSGERHDVNLVPERTRVTLTVNGQTVSREVPGGQLLIDFLRDDLCLTGAKVACGVGVCGLCTVLMDGKAISACLVPVVCVEGQAVWTVEGITALPPVSAANGTGSGAAAGHSDGGEAWDEAAKEAEDEAAFVPSAALMAEVQQALVECEGMQCGICTTGQVMSVYSMLAENPCPGEAEIRHHLAGNLCRCTGYQSIVRSVQLAAERWRQRHATL